MLMPLYQSQGTDGFFLVREVASFWLTSLPTFAVCVLKEFSPGCQAFASILHCRRLCWSIRASLVGLLSNCFTSWDSVDNARRRFSRRESKSA